MKKLNIWKKIAAYLLFMNLFIGAISTGPFSTGQKEGNLSVKHMGIGTSLKIGPGAKLFDGGSLSLLADYDKRQMLSMVLQDKDGTLVVIDGGWDIDADHLSEVIQSKGGHVSAWFITHPHSDHAGALLTILNDSNRKITIDHVYYGLADQAWYEKVESSRSSLVTDLRNALGKLPKESLHTVHKGEEFQFGGITGKVLNDPYLLDVTSVNNSSIAYKFFLNGVSILVLGDMGPEAGALLYEQTSVKDLKSDIVQMSHHGQYGVSREVYAAINPTIALWPCPLWLWNNDGGSGIGSGDWKTLETREWMKNIGVRANYCIKDGDQIIH